eukprot:CAMPEP_0181183028 /NCGR_PEP_ID=MMETSP1096-20121128/8200_1 /TAXON_ID=156174 ORGANISM="Chrysochromulina ericina, Strain CCMP281" /NCGR_SAMPLE_ID=MMETSP1096 /ASSEMBLY_ACC=CAM_ASM_000453 /LENGTH=113 /DNA_ID=CAMNT_0023271667 /DNA_START=296 /DNA_END=635 /DNA_ORIENTATION=+
MCGWPPITDAVQVPTSLPQARTPKADRARDSGRAAAALWPMSRVDALSVLDSSAVLAHSMTPALIGAAVVGGAAATAACESNGCGASMRTAASLADAKFVSEATWQHVSMHCG